MKIVIMNTSDIEGGAARCAFRLHKGILRLGLESVYVVQEKLSDDETVLGNRSSLGRILAIARPALDSLPNRFYRKRIRTYFSSGIVPGRISSHVNRMSPDIINLHWVAGGFLRVESFKNFKRPLVLTLHDSWAFTGGCHLPGNCERYLQQCGACPILESRHDHDLSYWNWLRKSRAWRNLDLTIVTDSRWLAECARNSSLFQGRRVEAINPGLDLNQFKPINKSVARTLLSLPHDKKLILFGAMFSTSDPNKGFHFLQSAIKDLASGGWGSRAELVVFGASEPSNPQNLGMKTHYLGRLHDDISLAALYSAADVTVVPSIRESFGQTASEAMACGTPVVAFAATGLLDTVEHLKTGYLARPFETEDLARGVSWVLEEGNRTDALSLAARLKAEQFFSIELMARKYMDLFKDVLATGT
jgi:glycosyltransferase involved in cell wall biosynthesis